MQKWYQIFQKNTGLNPFVWAVFLILPFYFIIRSTFTYEIIIGIVMIIGFFGCYALSFLTRGWMVYFWSGVQILISIAMTLMFGYVYFALFLAFYIGNIKNRAGFITLYSIHLVTTILTVNYGFVSKNPWIITQLPFVLLCVAAVILLPVTTYNHNRNDQLQVQLEDANKKIAELVKLEERQRIARDLHDTLGQKLSLIGLKSDLAGKLITKNPARAEAELRDVRQTARSALKEVRELVTEMRGTRFEDELFRITQILKAAQIELSVQGESELSNVSLMNENVLSMCLKEAVNNIVKHSGASECTIIISSGRSHVTVTIRDNGTGFASESAFSRGNGLRGMRERLEFVNGTMDIRSGGGTEVTLSVPKVLQNAAEEARV